MIPLGSVGKRGLLVCAAAVLGALSATAQNGTAETAEAVDTADIHNSDWLVSTGDKRSRRWAPLSQIDGENVARLEVAWRWSSPDNDLVASDERFQSRRMRPGRHEAGPLKVGDRLFITTGLGQLTAVDPASGRTLWVYDPKSYEEGRPTNLGFVHRGAAYWSDDEGDRRLGRLFYASGDARLHAVDAYTGEPVGGFGDRGTVDLVAGLRRPVSRRRYSVSSPVMLCRDTVIVGSSISDGATHPEGAPPGDVRGFDPRTGALRWTFHSIPQAGEVGNETWEEESWTYTGNTNVWTLMSADEELGLVYLPFGTPTNDWYGGHRPGDNLFGETLVAVDCETGERRWHFQAVHHGLWDYDLVTSPILADVTVDGRRRQVAAQLSKQGFLYVLDRETGEAIWPIEEREVPQSGVPGERTSPTQPFPTRPPPFERQGMGLADLIDFTPEIRAEALALLRRYRYGPIFTPPSERGTLQLPGWAGGASWPGGAFDPDTGLLFVPSFTVPIVIRLQKPDPSRSAFEFVGRVERYVEGPRGLPLAKPPYSRITAYDLGRGEIVWTVPLGDGPRDHPDLRHLDLPALGSGSRGHAHVTRTLLFVSSGYSLLRPSPGRDEAAEPLGWHRDTPALRAFDKATGELLWERRLPASNDGTPMSYLHDGRQYVLVPIGGEAAPAEILAFALPR